MEIKRRIDLVKLLPENSVGCECGVAEGYFSADLLEAGVAKLYSVDNWGTIEGIRGDGNFPQEWHDKNYEDAKKRLERFGDRSVILKGMTVEMANKVLDNSLDLLYLDAGHSYESVFNDLTAWYPKVKVGGIIASHDYLNRSDYQVYEAMQDFVKTLNAVCPIFPITENNDIDASGYFYKPLK